jgi:uncharacterized ion transporter superfamily protein YfcC
MKKLKTYLCFLFWWLLIWLLVSIPVHRFFYPELTVMRFSILLIVGFLLAIPHDLIHKHFYPKNNEKNS